MTATAGAGDFLKASKLSVSQIAFVLKEAEEDATVAEVCRNAGIGVSTHIPKFRDDRKEATRTNQVWTMDFVND